MKNWIFSALSLLSVICYFPAFSQEVIYSPNEKFDLRNGDFAVVGKSGNTIYTYRSGSDGFYLDAYNDSMNHLATVILDFFPKKIYETKFICYSNQIMVLYQELEGTKITQYAALLDEKGRLLKKPIELTSARTGFFGPTKNYFSSAISEDKKRVLIYSINTKGETLDFSGIWLDDQLNVLSRSHIAFKGENDVSADDVLIDNGGAVYLTASTPVGSHDYADQLFVLSLKDKDVSFTTAEFPLNKFFVTNSFIKMDNINHRIYIGGFYSEKKSGNYDGVLYGYYDMSSGTIQQNKLIAFDERIKNETGERNAKKAFNDYQVRQMIVKNDGGFVLIAESFYITTRNTAYSPGWGYYSMYYYGGPYMAPTVREYHYNDVVAISYDGQGNKEWNSFVRKEQYSQEDGGIFSSYALVNTGGMLGFLFNDFNAKQSLIQLATIDANGQTTMRSLAGGKGEDPDWLPRSGKQVSGHELIVPCLRKKQLCFARLSF